MTTVSEPIATRPRSSTPLGGLLLGIGVITVELLWATYLIDVQQQLAQHMPSWADHAQLVQWSFLSVPFLLLALAVGLGASSTTRALMAVGLCIAGAAVTIGIYELVTYVFTHGTPNLQVMKAVGYADVMMTSALAAVAWCVSRRPGASWLPPVLVVALLGAAAVQWWGWTPRLGTLNGHWSELVRAGLGILPIVLACLVAWGIELQASRAET